jgi:hypothetical protein
MLIECKSCHEKAGTPQMARALSTLFPAAGVSGLLCALLNDAARDSIFHHRGDVIYPDGLVFAIPFFVLFSWLFWQFPRWRMRSRYRHTPCPRCGACDWAQPRYSGFGV